jgi:hypothetical protein
LIDERIQIDKSEPQYANAPLSIETNLEPDSNVTVAREAHEEKQDRGILSIDEGIQIDERAEQPINAKLSIYES